jgi:hypothetical protein
MAAGIWFYLIMFLAVVFGGWGFWPPERRPYAPFSFLLWLAVLILGWRVLGPPIK